MAPGAKEISADTKDFIITINKESEHNVQYFVKFKKGIELLGRTKGEEEITEILVDDKPVVPTDTHKVAGEHRLSGTLSIDMTKPHKLTFAVAPQWLGTRLVTGEGMVAAGWSVSAGSNPLKIFMDDWFFYGYVREDVKNPSITFLRDGDPIFPAIEISQNGHVQSGMIPLGEDPNQHRKITFLPHGTWKSNQPIVPKKEKQIRMLPFIRIGTCGIYLDGINEHLIAHKLSGGVQGALFSNAYTGAYIGGKVGYAYIRDNLHFGSDLQLHYLRSNTAQEAVSSPLFRWVANFFIQTNPFGNPSFGVRAAAGFTHTLGLPGGNFSFGPFVSLQLSRKAYLEFAVSYQGDWLKQPFRPEPTVQMHAIQASVSLYRFLYYNRR